MSLKVGDSFTCTQKEYDMIRSYQRLLKLSYHLSWLSRLTRSIGIGRMILFACGVSNDTRAYILMR